MHTSENSKQTKVFLGYNQENALGPLLMQVGDCLHYLLSSFSMFLACYPISKTELKGSVVLQCLPGLC